MRKLRNKEMDEANHNYFDGVAQGMEKEGFTDMADFLAKLNKREEIV